MSLSLRPPREARGQTTCGEFTPNIFHEQLEDPSSGRRLSLHQFMTNFDLKMKLRNIIKSDMQQL